MSYPIPPNKYTPAFITAFVRELDRREQQQVRIIVVATAADVPAVFARNLIYAVAS